MLLQRGIHSDYQRGAVNHLQFFAQGNLLQGYRQEVGVISFPGHWQEGGALCARLAGATHGFSTDRMDSAVPKKPKKT